ncbi:MlaD family protein [Neisseriaceae bacterium TC5R-5]|nr:MlaD family protein [Neisseriaceae bacterium TC5R-5]
MSDEQNVGPANVEPDLPRAVPLKKRRWSPSLVWLIPIVALLVGGWLAVNAILSRGPTITVSFQNAEGLEAGKTRIRYKNVEVGEVKSIVVSPDRKSIIVTAELSNKVDSYLVEDSRFWVVRPRISGGSISGLGTVLSGAYISLDVGKSAKRRTDFIGLEIPPIINADLPGKRFLLRTDSLGSLNTGSPVYFRRVPVGQVISYELGPTGNDVRLSVFINAPYDHFVSSNTRFWHASGIDFSVGADGVRVSTESLAAIALGGISFETPLEDGSELPPTPSAVFLLSENRTKALRNPDSEMQLFRLKFRQSVRGLVVGAPVDFRGIVIGEVSAIGVAYAGHKDFDMTVDIRTYPSRINALSGDKATTKKLSIESLVSNGLRAQLRSGSLLTGQLYVALDFFPDAKPAPITVDKGVAELPTLPGDLEELQRLMQRIARRLDQVPFDTIGQQTDASLKALRQSLESMQQLTKNMDANVLPQTVKVLEQVQKTLDSAQHTLKADSPLQQDMRSAAQEVSETARSFRALAEYLSRHPEALVRGKGEQK